MTIREIQKEIVDHLKASNIRQVRDVVNLDRMPQRTDRFPVIGPRWAQSDYDVDHGSKTYSSLTTVEVWCLVNEADRLKCDEVLDSIVFSNLTDHGFDGVLESLLKFRSRRFLLTPLGAEPLNEREDEDARFTAGIKVRCQVQRIG